MYTRHALYYNIMNHASTFSATDLFQFMHNVDCILYGQNKPINGNVPKRILQPEYTVARNVGRSTFVFGIHYIRVQFYP